MKTYKGFVTELADNQVFCFGSNLQGFHGAGSAGFATFNKPGNIWREKNYDMMPDGTPGRWNIKGVGWGFQQGRVGKSYAIPTVTHAGRPRSMSLDQIAKHVRTLKHFALGNPQWEFLIAQENKVGYNGYTPEEMATVWEILTDLDNVVFSELFIPYIQ